MKKSQKIKIIIAICIALVVGIVLGSFFSSSGKHAEVTHKDHDHSTPEVHSEIWTCSMHPQIRQSEPGDCPICGMELIPLESDNSGGIDPDAIAMTPDAMKLARVETAVVGGGSANEKTLTLNGKITEDERRVYIQSSHIPGRVEDLKINFTGEYVSKGQEIARIYSPELVTAQQELFEAKKIKDTQPALYNAAIQKLKNWKIRESAIQNIVASDKIRETLPITAGISGYVTEKLVNPGDYITQGQPLYKIADLSEVWVMFDVYESEMEWVKKGDKIAFTVASLPGKTFSGTIDYIDPIINPETRVAKARVSVKNPGKELKPEMFVTGQIKSQLSDNAEIAVPKTAVMWTGKRSVVYVMHQTETATTFQMREITLGPALGDSYIITDGLKAGEEIAVNGTFSIDAAAQLAGKPSMMSPLHGDHQAGGSEPDEMETGEHRPTAQKTIRLDGQASQAIDALLVTYLKLKDELADDQFVRAKGDMKRFAEEIHSLDHALKGSEAMTTWLSKKKIMETALGQDDLYDNIGELRKAFRSVSENLIAFLQATDYSHAELVVDYCPMANSNKGAVWLSTDSTIRNPYFGEVMLSCGEIQADFK